MKKKITKEELEFLKETAELIDRCVEYYEDEKTRVVSFCNGICLTLKLNSTYRHDELSKVLTAFNTTKPDNSFGDWWFDRFDPVPRLTHMKRLQKELKDFIKKNS